MMASDCIRLLRSRDSATLKVGEKFDFDCHKEFRASCNALDKSIKKVVVDLGQTEYMDSSALGMLLLLRDEGVKAGFEISLVNCKPGVRRILDIANFSRFFGIG